MTRPLILIAALAALIGWYGSRPITVGDLYAAAGMRLGDGKDLPPEVLALGDRCGEWLLFERQCLAWSTPVKEAGQ